MLRIILALVLMAVPVLGCILPSEVSDAVFLCENRTYAVSDIMINEDAVLDCQGATLSGNGTGVIIKGKKGAVRNCVFEGFLNAVVVEGITARIEYNTFRVTPIINLNGTLLLKGNINASVLTALVSNAPKEEAVVAANVEAPLADEKKAAKTDYSSALAISAYNSAIIVQVIVGFMVLVSLGAFVFFERVQHH